MFEGIFQPMHMLVILAIALLFFGPGKLPQLGAGLGKSIREFKKAIREIPEDESNKAAVPEVAHKQADLQMETVQLPHENKSA